MAVPGGVPGGVPGATPGAGVVGQQSVTPPVIKRPGWTPAMGPMNPNAALALLMGNGFGAKSYYNGVPDLSAGANKREVRTRDVIKSKLLDIVIPKVDPLHDVTMNEVITRLQLLLRQSDPSGVGFNMVVNQFIDPGGAAIAPTPAPGGGTAGPGGPGGGMAIDPVTGLPTGGGGDPTGGNYPEGGGSGEPQMAMPKYGGYPKMRPFNSMGGYYAPGNLNSFSARPQGFPNFRR